MIKRFRKITDGLYRGSAPSPQDVMRLKEQLGINKIVSLDKETGDKIDRACKLLGIDHVKAYIDHDRKSLFHVLQHNLKHLLLDGGPTYIHCHEGKDRTGLIAALFKCKYMGVSPDKAIDEAKSLGFGAGIDPAVTKLYEKLIKSCGHGKDNNSADIVSNERDYKGDNRDTFLDEQRQDSFAPYLDHTRQNPADAVYTYTNDQAPTRQNYHSEKDSMLPDELPPGGIPNVGQYDNDAGQRGFGPVEEINGWFSEVGH